ncbi:uncharacterized protein LOC110188438 [Drosophila serrata]|uniref:uncharacterized protein LOC110188438 n=1 Tax=Drosophila serrata TaxID=7274 RepID=UPI000A1D2892|nr:uncharacterized protein LOC110188438 [Drosophila serrata]
MRTEAAVTCFLVIINSVCCQSGGGTGEENWVDPHPAWSDFAMDLDCKCPAVERSPAAVEDALALTYFRKFANLLFQRKRLQFDKEKNVYKRSLLFSVLPSQLEELEIVRDARDLDVVLTKILESAQAAPLFEGKFGCSYAHKGNGVFALITDIFKDFVALAKISEVQFLLFVAFSITLGYIVRRRYRYGIITIFLGGVFLFGYLHTYLECNRKLEVDAMLEVIDTNQETGSYAEMSWFSRLKNYVSRASPGDKQKEMIRKSSKLNLPYCRPDEVFLMYANDLFLKQLEVLLERVSHTMTKLTNGLSFPYNLIAPLFLVALVGYIIKLTFKYVISPKAWASLVHSRTEAPVAQPIGANEPNRDCISGENLKMLLNVMNVTNVQRETQQQALPSVSGVQELLEPPQTSPKPSPKKEETLDTSDGSNKSRRSKQDMCSVYEEEGFTLVDDHEDDVDNIDTL